MVKPLIIQSKLQWRMMLDDAIVRTDEKLALDPNREMLKSIREQLRFMKQSTVGDRSPTPEEAEQVTIGPMAAKNLEEEDAEYATWLKELDYAFRKRWRGLP
jgi:Tsi6